MLLIHIKLLYHVLLKLVYMFSHSSIRKMDAFSITVLLRRQQFWTSDIDPAATILRFVFLLNGANAQLLCGLSIVLPLLFFFFFLHRLLLQSCTKAMKCWNWRLKVKTDNVEIKTSVWENWKKGWWNTVLSVWFRLSVVFKCNWDKTRFWDTPPPPNPHSKLHPWESITHEESIMFVWGRTESIWANVFPPGCHRAGSS